VSCGAGVLLWQVVAGVPAGWWAGGILVGWQAAALWGGGPVGLWDGIPVEQWSGRPAWWGSRRPVGGQQPICSFSVL
jgi:hypothetical protein